jgi:CBS-domain-containing membrane protein
MRTTTAKSLHELTARNLMNPDVIVLPAKMPLRDAARLLLQRQVGGAPVVDADGCCIGVLSVTDFLRMAVKRADAEAGLSPPSNVTCPFQVKHRIPDGHEVILCTLPPGVCPIQLRQKRPDGTEVTVCSQPNCVLSDWQVVDLENLPMDEVRSFMTPDAVTVQPDTLIRNLARLMIDAHIHRIIVVDERRRPIGVVSSTDVLAAVAYSGDE